MERDRCHVCGSVVGVRRPMPDIEPTCSKNECLLAASGMISVAEARQRLDAQQRASQERRRRADERRAAIG